MKTISRSLRAASFSAILIALALHPAIAVTNIWTGAGADNFWMTAANWSNNVAPVAGNDLVFPPGAARLSNSNNFPAGTVFNVITFSGGNYTLRGSAITLNGGIDAAPATGVNVFQIPLTLNSNQTVTTGIATLTLGGAIDTNGKNLLFAGTVGTSISGRISGSGNLIVLGPGFASLQVSNTFSGTVHILQGSMSIQDGNALGSAAGSTTISNGGLLTLASSSISVPEPMIVSGRLASAGTAGTKFLTAPITLGSTNASIEANSGAPLTINGIVSGGGFTKSGPDILTLNAANTFTGSVTVAAGTLRLNNLQFQTSIFLTGGTLAGTGTSGNATAVDGFPSTVAPGIGAPGFLTCSNLALTAAATFGVELNGTTAGSGHDQLRVRGSVALNNAKLSVSLGFTPTVGQTFIVLDNDGADSIIGTFGGLPEGTTFAVGTNQFRVTYLGGTGNDVVLLRTNLLVTGVTRIWTGAGSNNFWTEPANWTNNLPGGPGDNLLFPAGAARTINSNNLPAGTIFNSITFSGGSYSLAGSAIGLNAGINATNNAPANTIVLPVTLRSNQTFVSSNSGVGLSFFQTIDTGGRELTLAGNGFIGIGGQISGTGSLIKTGNGSAALSASNSFAGTVQVLQGALSISHSNSLGSTNTGTTIGSAGALSLVGGVNVFEPLTLGGTLFGSSFDTLKGPITLTGTNATIGPLLIIDGLISGTGFTKIGSDVLILNANNTYTGQTFVEEGRLEVNGSQPKSPIVLGGIPLVRTLSGTGRVGNVLAIASNLSLVSPGVFGPGLLNVSNITLNSSASFAAELNGLTPGSGYDQLQVAGTVNLGEANLAFSLGFTPAIGDLFTIISNDGADAVSGTFKALPEGSVITNAGANFSISYAGGDGNDVVLQRVSAPLQLTGIITLSNGTPQIQGVGSSNLTITIQATTNLQLMAFWSNVGAALADSNGVFFFTDTNAALFPMRFYRARVP